MTIRIVCYGIPATQGSQRALISASTGKAITLPDNKAKLASWRSAVAWEAARIMQGRSLLDGPLELRATFHLPRPVSAPKRRRHPDRKPDLDKLKRAIGDALKGVIYTDDARICRAVTEKVYGEPARAEIEIEELHP